VTASSLKISRWILPLLGGNGRLSSYAFLGFDSVIVSFGKWVSIILKLKREIVREGLRNRGKSLRKTEYEERTKLWSLSLSAHREIERERVFQKMNSE
jgi:hypothetical protein